MRPQISRPDGARDIGPIELDPLAVEDGGEAFCEAGELGLGPDRNP
jgi:hypothetical protein